MSGSKKIRVYLSKSRAGKTEDLNKALSLLKQYDIEIVMWDSSQGYDKQKHYNLVKSCDIFILLPPKLPKAFNYNFTIGKGQSVELDIAEKEKLDIFAVICLGNELYISYNFIEDDIIDENWQTNYRYIEMYNSMNPLHIEHDDISLLKENISTKVRPMLACITLFK